MQVRKDRRDAVQAFGTQDYDFLRNEKYTAHVQYTADNADAWHTATRIDDAFLELAITGMNDRPIFLTVRCPDPSSPGDWLFHETHAFNLSGWGLIPAGTIQHQTKPSHLRIVLPSALRTHMQNMAQDVQLTFELVHNTYGGRIEFGNDDGNAPRFVVEGEFTRYENFADNSLQYRYDDNALSSSILLKVDDANNRYSSVPPGARRTERRHSFGADYRVLKSETLIGDPDNPVRTDVSSAVYSGQGLLLRATDAEGSTTATLYDD
ncbi:MAG: hypothetical protein AAFW74_17015, partial [Pseudomonadota bacterium]